MKSGAIYDPVRLLVRFNEKFNDDGQGGPWTISGREFIVQEIYRPLFSYARIPAGNHPPEAVCDECRKLLGSWIFDAFAAALHGRLESCVGMIAVPIVNTGDDLPRQSGKTTTGFSIPYATMFTEQFEAISFVASAEDQAEELLERKLVEKLKRHEALKALAHVTANKLTVASTNSQLEILPASHGSVTGRSTTLNIFDECRDQKARVVTASMPAVLAQHGYKCPPLIALDGTIYPSHGRWKARPNGEPEFETCPHTIGKGSKKRRCGRRLVRFHGRQLLLSASGVIEDDPSKDWFRDWIDNRLQRPDPRTHVWRTDKKVNPSVSADIHEGISGSFGDVPGMKDHLGVELHNAPARLGEVYITGEELDGATSRELQPVPKSEKPALAFIDASKTTDLTSLVVCVESSGKFAPFEVMDLAHVQVWDPHDRESCPTGVIDERLVSPALEAVVASFPGLLRIVVDTRLMPWAKKLVREQKTKPWGRKVGDTEGWTNTVNSVMYGELHQRIRGRTIRLWSCLAPIAGKPRCEECAACELRHELLAMRKRDLPGGGIEVYDAGGDKAGRNRRKGGIHREVAMSLAGCCKLAAEKQLEQVRGNGGAIATRANENRAVSAALRPIASKPGRKW